MPSSLALPLLAALAASAALLLRRASGYWLSAALAAAGAILAVDAALAYPDVAGRRHGVVTTETIARKGIGKDYVDTLRHGLNAGWVDWLPSTGKSSGAYSTGAYGVHPYQLQNFTGKYDEVGTLAHESGHSMHTFYSYANQPFVSADYDDGYMVWINGIEIFRSPEMPAGNPLWNTFAGSHESSNAEDPVYGSSHDVTAKARSALHDGTNVAAVGVWNASSSSSDLVLVPRLGLAFSLDNCPDTPNPGQEDGDGDGIGDACEG